MSSSEPLNGEIWKVTDQYIGESDEWDGLLPPAGVLNLMPSGNQIWELELQERPVEDVTVNIDAI